jgi:hypothetical protein
VKFKLKSVLQNLPNTACSNCLEHPSGSGFGVWWLYPPNPALIPVTPVVRRLAKSIEKQEL